jgi:hypothetical protein
MPRQMKKQFALAHFAAAVALEFLSGPNYISCIMNAAIEARRLLPLGVSRNSS